MIRCIICDTPYDDDEKQVCDECNAHPVSGVLYQSEEKKSIEEEKNSD